jgi:aspartyl-tRNA(Asn)/glutamyl-tRNA(Gln) amidotransferase subunit B
MERGHLRCDANVSIRIQGSDVLNPKTETKNVNSIENVRDAIQAEIKRQIREVKAGRTIEAWTLDWDEDSGTLRKMRVKETEADYRYFREPDLLPIELDEAWRDEILSALPELPLERRARIAKQYDIPIYDAEILTEERSLADYFEKAVEVYDGEPKTVSNWLMNDVLRIIRSKGIKAGGLQLQPHHLVEIIRMVDEKKITTNTAKSLLDQVEETGNTPIEIVERENLAQVSDEGALRQVIAEVIAGNPDQVKTYRAGKESVIGWFVGQVMRETKGKANPQLVQELLGEMLAGE